MFWSFLIVFDAKLKLTTTYDERERERERYICMANTGQKMRLHKCITPGFPACQTIKPEVLIGGHSNQTTWEWSAHIKAILCRPNECYLHNHISFKELFCVLNLNKIDQNFPPQDATLTKDPWLRLSVDSKWY